MEGQRKRENWLQKVKQMKPEYNLMQCDINKSFDAIFCIKGIFISGLLISLGCLKSPYLDRTSKQDSYL